MRGLVLGALISLDRSSPIHTSQTTPEAGSASRGIVEEQNAAVILALMQPLPVRPREESQRGEGDGK